MGCLCIAHQQEFPSTNVNVREHRTVSPAGPHKKGYERLTSEPEVGAGLLTELPSVSPLPQTQGIFSNKAMALFIISSVAPQQGYHGHWPACYALHLIWSAVLLSGIQCACCGYQRKAALHEPFTRGPSSWISAPDQRARGR
jgi:hypothetical protein